MSKISGLQATLSCKCPKCREGNMFINPMLPKWYNTDMHKYCEVCEQSFEPEPGFYFGAMFVSYGFSVVIFFISGLILFNIYDEPSTWAFVSLVSVQLFVFWPAMMKLSRAIFLHGFGGIGYRA